MAVYTILYLAALITTVLYTLRQLRRMADAQEENSRHLLEIARDIKAIAISTVEKEK